MNSDLLAHQAQLSRAIGQDVPLHVATKAMADPRYHYHLVAARTNSAWLHQLYSLAPQPSPAETPVGSTGLVLGVVSSMVRWASSGFKFTADSAFERRWDACLKCEYLIAAPEKAIYHLGRKIIATNDDRICAKCGCFAYAKAKVPTEACPVASEHDSSLSRWGESNPISEITQTNAAEQDGQPERR